LAVAFAYIVHVRVVDDPVTAGDSGWRATMGEEMARLFQHTRRDENRVRLALNHTVDRLDHPFRALGDAKGDAVIDRRDERAAGFAMKESS
jgi:hypothetical protein